MTRDEYEQKTQSGELAWEKCPAREEVANPNDIIVDKEWNSEHPQFWNHHGRSKGEYLDYVNSGQADKQTPPEVYKCDDKYILVDDGNHRVAASKELNRPIKVNVVGEYSEQKQSKSMDEENEEEMSM
jgi:hypothetical protein